MENYVNNEILHTLVYYTETYLGAFFRIVFC